MKTQKTVGMASMFGLAVLVAAATSYGQGVGNLGSLPTTFYGPNAFVVADPAGAPVGVEFNPAGPAWIKTFDFGAVLPQPGQQFTVYESLQVTGNLPWQDWHEKALSPGWDWDLATTFLANGLAPAGLSVSVTPSSLTSGGSIDYTFNSLPVGTVVDIYKTLVYTGIPGTAWQGPVRIAEAPTPEPATVSLLALGGLAMLRRARRTR